MENSTNVPQKIKNRESLDDLTVHSWVYVQRKQNNCTALFTAALSIRAPTQKQPVSTEGGVLTENVLRKYGGILFSHRKEGNLAVEGRIYGPSRHFAK